MLPHRSHHRFAYTQQSLERERREACFANRNDDDDDTTTPEQLPGQEEEQLPEKPAPIIEGRIASEIEQAKGQIERVAPLVTKGIINSPFVLAQGVTMMLRDTELVKRLDITDASTLEEDIEKRIEELQQGKDTTELSKAIESKLLEFSNDPEVALRITQAFDQRLERYKELKDDLGEKNLPSLAEAEVLITARERMGTGGSRTRSDLEKTLASVGINTKEEAKKLQKFREEGVIIPKADIDEFGNPTDAYLLRLLEKKFANARKLSVMEKNDLGTETTLAEFSQVEKGMFQQLRHARKHLERIVQLEAQKRNQLYQEKIIATIKQYNDRPSEIPRVFGVSPKAFMEKTSEAGNTIEATMRKLRSDTGNLPKPSDPGFTREVERLLRELNDLSWLEKSKEHAFDHLLSIERDKHRDAIEWAAQTGQRLERLFTDIKERPEIVEQTATELGIPKEQLQSDILPRLEDNLDHLIVFRDNPTGATSENHDFLYDVADATRRERLNAFLTAFEHACVRQSLGNVRRDFEATPQHEEKSQIQEAAQAQLDKLTKHNSIEQQLLPDGKLCKGLDHTVTRALGVQEILQKDIYSMKEKLEEMVDPDNSQQSLWSNDLRKITLRIQQMSGLAEKVKLIGSGTFVQRLTANDFEKKSGSKKGQGFFSHKTERIYINNIKVQGVAAEARLVEHEKGHAIIHFLTRTCNILPNLLIGSYNQLRYETAVSSNQTFEELLESMTEEWGIHVKNNEEKLDLLMDELWNKYASWIDRGRPPLQSSTIQQLYQMLEGAEQTEVPQPTLNLPETGPERGLFQLEEDETEEPADDDREDATETESSNINIPQQIMKHRENVTKIKTFIDTHPSVPELGMLQQIHDEANTALRNIENDFIEDGNEHRANERLMQFKSDLDATGILSGIKAYQKTELEMVGTSGGGKGTGGLFPSITWISIMDIVQIGKSSLEDLQRMWKRRGERVQSTVGESLFGWIPDNSLPGLSYLGQLKHEFIRRSHSSEIEEVNQWKEALKEMDAFSLQALLKGTKNKDQVRAIVEILTEAGRMDWNDTEFWKTLLYLASQNYNMPIKACLNNDILRDQWLQTLVTDIWDDKDKFNEWKSNNNSNITSGKGKFTATADQFANIGGGLPGRLQQQLKLWVEAKEGGIPPPDEVNPHLYEEILHYSMRNGKMSMEQKLFFLVQGVRHKLLSIDRLRTLAGEDAGVLNQFPFIDYFFMHNNTLTEITALGKRLEETDPKIGHFAPGSKTTLWLHLELLRDESARQRISKATSGTRAEELDHEDVPTIVAQMDYEGISRLTDVVSGSREKLSPEAVKNAYTGFGTKFKVLARLAQLAKAGKAQFTHEDAMEAAKSIVTYIHMDNIFTRNGTEAERRNKLTFTQINTEQGPSTNGLLVKDYRDANSKFVLNLFDRVGDQINWGKTKTNRENYIRKLGDEDLKEQKFQENNFKASQTVDVELRRILSDPGNREILMDVLIDSADDLLEENFAIKNADPKDQHISKGKMQNYLQRRRGINAQ